MSTVPPTNKEAFTLIYEIENCLRELIIERLSELDGALWYKNRLPGDILKRYREGIAAERSISWSRLVPHHPMYYVDFPHLREVITNGKNWEPVFKKIFVRREVFEGNFVELEAIRNRLAHNRKLSTTDITIARAVHSVFSDTLGSERLHELSGRCTRNEDLTTELETLKSAAERTRDELREMLPLSLLHIWKRIGSEWWFDDDYLGSNITAIRDFFARTEEYDALPRARGTGHEIEKWLRHNNIEDLYTKANDALMAAKGLL